MNGRPPQPSPHWAYFLDVDGTLVELAETPEQVVVDRSMLRLVSVLVELTDGAVAVVSGRALSDLDRRLALPALPMAGQHGLERRDSRGRLHRHGGPAVGGDIVSGRLLPLISKYPGLRLENKGASVALHYRQAPQLGSYLHRIARQTARELGGLQLQSGKRVVEIKPGGYDKGGAIEEFLAEPPFAGRRPVFIGDDLTDEHGFAVVNSRGGISIKVGPGRSAATYRLPNVAAVLDWLGQAVEQPARQEETE